MAVSGVLPNLALVFCLVGCSPALPPAGQLPSLAENQKAAQQRFVEDSTVIPVIHVKVPASSLKVSTARLPLPPESGRRKIKLVFQKSDTTVGDLVQALSLSDIQISFRWSNAKSEDVLKRRLPFTTFSGNLEGLLASLRTGLGFVSWQEGSMIFLSDLDRYTITLPQNEDLLKAMSGKLKDLGAENIVYSTDTGNIIYSATPSNQDEVISPFLTKATKNLSTIGMQVAIVTLTLNDKTANGFDWSKLASSIDQRSTSLQAANASTAPASPTTGTGTSTSTTTTTTSTTGTNTVTTNQPTSVIDEKGAVTNLSGTSLIFGGTALGKVLGVNTAFSVSAAIDWLSTFGNATVTQHVDLRTLSGKEVKFHSGEKIPYVKSIGVGSTGSNTTTSGSAASNTLGQAQTDTVETGLTVNLTPRYDSDSKLVIVDVDMELKSLLEMVQLSAGNQLGTLTQPHTQEQTLNDIIRMEAGRTVVIGGLQYDSEQYTGNEPTALRETLAATNTSTGLRSQDIKRNALFVILRPTVTVYEPEGQ